MLVILVYYVGVGFGIQLSTCSTSMYSRPGSAKSPRLQNFVCWYI